MQIESYWKTGLKLGTILLLPYLIWEIFWYAKVGQAAIKWHTYLVTGSFILYLLLPAFFHLPRLQHTAFWKYTSFFLTHSWLLGLYVFGSYLIGESHPFTMVPMYNQFPNYAYSFKLTDTQGNIVPFKEHFSIRTGQLAHKFTAVAQKLQVMHGFRKESQEDLAQIGKVLMSEINQTVKVPPKSDSLRLILVCYYLQDDSIATNERLMYEDVVKR